MDLTRQVKNDEKGYYLPKLEEVRLQKCSRGKHFKPIAEFIREGVLRKCCLACYEADEDRKRRKRKALAQGLTLKQYDMAQLEEARLEAIEGAKYYK